MDPEKKLNGTRPSQQASNAATPVSDRPCETEMVGAWSGVVGNSPAFAELQRNILRIARTDAPVLIEGETGVGKELVARAIHYTSARAGKPFVPLNCGAIPEALIESEMFGHTRGSFTDARTSRDGLLAQAHAGTLFLDEIDSLPIKGQVAMLRFLQDRRYRPVGHNGECVSDARVIAATNQPLRELAERGAFRSDLMFRLNIIRLVVPPLRERRRDLPLLVRHFLRLYSERYGLPLRPLHPDSWNWLMQYDWPGNVRELESAIHRGVLLSEAPQIVFDEANASLEAHPHGLDAAYEAADTHCADAAGTDQASPYPTFHRAKANAIEAFERDYLARLLARTRGNVSAAARLANKERRALGKLIKKYGLSITSAQP